MPLEPAFRQPLSPEKILRLDHLCDQFEAEWLAGMTPQLEQLLLASDEELRPHLFHELLDLETRYRRQEGRPLTSEEATHRFASLGPWAGEVLAAFHLDSGADSLLLEVLVGPIAGQLFGGNKG